MYHCFRFTKGMDLKKEIEKYATDNQVSGVILCCVGCLSKVTIRLAGAKAILSQEGNFEIVSITGTLSKDGVHIHISVSDEKGNTIGGHLKDGCTIDTTAEICLLEFENIKLSREYDDATGYEELVIQ